MYHYYFSEDNSNDRSISGLEWEALYMMGMEVEDVDRAPFIAHINCGDNARYHTQREGLSLHTNILDGQYEEYR
jgi:hypothetical protein